MTTLPAPREQAFPMAAAAASVGRQLVRGVINGQGSDKGASGSRMWGAWGFSQLSFPHIWPEELEHFLRSH